MNIIMFMYLFLAILSVCFIRLDPPPPPELAPADKEPALRWYAPPPPHPLALLRGNGVDVCIIATFLTVRGRMRPTNTN